jgi:hypothetical protein
MREFAIRRGWTVIDAVAAMGSGATDHRPKRQELLTAARQRKLEVILVWKLDRWGRSLVDLMMTLHELTALGSGLSRSRRRSISRPSRTCFRWLPGGVCGVRTRLDPSTDQGQYSRRVQTWEGPWPTTGQSERCGADAGTGAARPQSSSNCAALGPVAHVGAAGVDAAGGDVRGRNAVRRGMGVRKTRDM